MHKKARLQNRSLTEAGTHPYCWGIWTRTINDRTRICSVTITPYPNFAKCGAKVSTFYDTDKLFLKKVRLICFFSVISSEKGMKTKLRIKNRTISYFLLFYVML